MAPLAPTILTIMDAAQRFERGCASWWKPAQAPGRAFVYDPGSCEVLYAAQRMNPDAAKLAAVDFAAAILFGGDHDLKPAVIVKCWHVMGSKTPSRKLAAGSAFISFTLVGGGITAMPLAPPRSFQIGIRRLAYTMRDGSA